MTGAEVAAAAKFTAGYAKPAGGWLWRKMRPDTSRTALIGYTDNLADDINRRETDVLDQLRAGPDMVIDDLEFRAEHRLKLSADNATGVLADIGPYFRRQETPRRMVILGDAGAGKTVLAVRFVLDQLRYRATLADAVRADEPVPVRVNAAGWDGSIDFTAWLVNQLAIGYVPNPRVARAMVYTGRILPVVDGLDEMDPPNAAPVLACAALERVNKSPWLNRAVVVACRTNVYAAIRELRDDAGLQFATTITLQPFSADNIYFHLEQYRDELGIAEAAWAPVTDQLIHTPDGILATELRTPWLLSLAATALNRGRHGSAIALAACRDPTEIRDLLFGSLIPAAVEGTTHTGRFRGYSEQNVNKWMQTLARDLERRSDFSGGTQFGLDEVWKLAGIRRCRALHPLVVGLVAGLVGLLIGLMVGVGVAFWPGLNPGISLWIVPVCGLIVALALGVECGLSVGFIVGIIELQARIGGNKTKRIKWLVWPKWLAWRIPGAPSPGEPQRFAWRVPGRSRWRRGVAFGLASGLLFLLGPLVLSGSASPPPFGILGGSSLIFAIFVGLWRGLGTTPEERLALGQDARRVIRDDLVAGLVLGLLLLGVCLVVIGPLLGLALGRAHGLHYPLAMGLLIGLVVGIGFGVMFGLSFAVVSGRHATASLLFGFTGIFPRRPAQFLEWARNTGLLRVTGIAYQFRHDTYQQWLVGGVGDRDVTVRSAPPADACSG